MSSCIGRYSRCFLNPGSLTLALLFLPFFFITTLPTTSHAAEIVVETAIDEIETNNRCSLREAIVNSNQNFQAYPDCPAGEVGPAVTDVIVLSAETYVLTRVCDDIFQFGEFPADCDDLDITDDLIVRGVQGTDQTVIRTEPDIEFLNDETLAVSLFEFRIFDFDPEFEEVDASAICDRDSSCDVTNLTIEDVTLSDGQDCAGGAIRSSADSSCSVASLTLNRVNLRNNVAYCSGGAVWARGILSVNDSNFFSNESSGPGGGISYLRGRFRPDACDVQSFTAAINNSDFEGNYSFYSTGGAVHNGFGATMTITGSNMDSNGAGRAGGGVANEFGNLSISDTTIIFNGGVPADGFDESGPDSIIPNGDDSEEYGPLFGGGVYNVGSTLGGELVPVNIAEDFVTVNKLTITDSTISDNRALIAGGGIANNGPLFGCTETRSLFEGGQASVGDLLGFCDDGALSTSNIAEEFEVEVNVSGSTISGNTALAGGGVHHGVLTAKFIIDSSTISENLALLGGGILNRWVMMVTNSTISNNSNIPEESVVVPTAIDIPQDVNGNIVVDEPQGDEQPNLLPIALGSGGGVFNLGRGEFENTTISGNTAFGSGAGILNLTGPLYYIFYLITNPELFPEPSPTASPSPTSTPLNGDEGIEFDSLPAPGTFLRSVTITENVIPLISDGDIGGATDFPIDGLSLVSNGGGVATYFGEIAVRNSIIAGNEDNQENIDILFEDIFGDDEDPFAFDPEPDFAPDCTQFQDLLGAVCEELLAESPFAVEEICAPLTPQINSQFYNLIGDNTGCSPFEAENGEQDQVGTGESPIDPGLGALQDNGGSTFTHYLTQGSPAIDSANPSAVLMGLVDGEEEFACPAADQIGTARPEDGDADDAAQCDIGAVEIVADCLGVPQGTAVLDECGVCDGDGSSCAPTPTPTPEEDQPVQVSCETVDITSDQFGLDGAGLEQNALNRELATRAKRRGARGSRRLARESQEFYDMIWANTWGVESVLSLNCSGPVAEQCVEISNVSAYAAVVSASDSMQAISNKLIRKLRRVGVPRRVLRNLRRRAARLNASVETLVASLPTTSVQCVS